MGGAQSYGNFNLIKRANQLGYTVLFGQTEKGLPVIKANENGYGGTITMPYGPNDERFPGALAHEVAHAEIYSKGLYFDEPNSAKMYALREVYADAYADGYWKQWGGLDRGPIYNNVGDPHQTSEEYRKNYSDQANLPENASDSDYTPEEADKADEAAGASVGDAGFEDYISDLFNWGDADWKNILDPYYGLDRDGDYRIAYYDPLTLDLDGDGIETVGASGWAGSLFDMDNDGIRAATGWVKSDDGLLVFDRNGNGTIDNGSELFGDHTSLSSGGLAADGFAALADLDANHDGVVDASDADFQSLKIWRDLNQDGVSSADELFTLSQLGIVSLNLTYTNTNQTLTGGNVLAQVGSYTMADGTVRQMGDVNLAADQLHTEYAEHIELTPEQASQANIQGMGRLRDLREAAALSGSLANMLACYSRAISERIEQVFSNYFLIIPQRMF